MRLSRLRAEAVKAPHPWLTGRTLLPIQATGKKVLIVIPQSDFQDKEYTTVRDALNAAGCQVAVATRDHAAAVGVSGTSVTPDVLLGRSRLPTTRRWSSSAARGAENLYNLESARNVAIDAVKENRVLGAICLAPVILARAGVLEGRRATVYYFRLARTHQERRRIHRRKREVDGRIITGNGPEASSEFAAAVLSAL